MYTRYKYSVREVLLWTRMEILWLLLLAFLYTALYELAGWHWMEIPWTPLALVGTAVAFLIGFQNNAAYGRAWEARKIWGGIVNESRTWAIMAQNLITDEHAAESVSPEELAQHRSRLIHRHIAWLTALRHAMRVKRSWEVFAEHRTSKEWYEKVVLPERDTGVDEELKPLLGEKEYERVAGQTNKAVAIMAIQSNDVRELKERGLIWEFSFLEFHAVIRELIVLQGKSERIKNFPYPRQFATIGHDLVRVFVLLLPLGIIPQFSRLGEQLSEGSPMTGRYFVWLAVPVVATIAWVFHTMLRIGTSGENPFEGSANDVPISTIARGIEIDMREINGESQSQIPDPLPTVHNVQM
ncbi:MAG: bestrophin family ion channel [Planctomycetota bacterium]